MDLTTALHVVDTPLLVPGRSDAGLIDNIRPQLSADGDWIRRVRQLDQTIRIRPVDLLLALAKATRPKYERDVHDVYAFWAVLRYLGVFDVGEDGRCRLSQAGRRIAGNQRRVLSEELGIGMAATLAPSWMGSRGSGNVDLIDIDLLLTPEFPWLLASPGATRRPDYLLVETTDGRARIRLLESKGSRNPGAATRQLVSAYEQLGGLLIDGRPARGLAVAATVADGHVAYSVVERCPPLQDEAGELLRATSVPPPWLDAWYRDEPRPVPEFGSALEVDAVGRSAGPDRRADAAAPAALAASWSVLSDLAANDDAFERWAGPARRGQSREGRRQRREFDEGDLRIRGTSSSIALPGGQLEAVLGVLDYVDDALLAGSSRDVLEAQSRARAETGPHQADVEAGRRPAFSPADEAVIAWGADGTVLRLRLV